MKHRVKKKQTFRRFKEYALKYLPLAFTSRKDLNDWAHEIARKA
ncbi:MAG: hypothetical protein WC365_10135 [Candidatus Babeliales bacterium]|jgi:hypothetical protein